MAQPKGPLIDGAGDGVDTTVTLPTAPIPTTATSSNTKPDFGKFGIGEALLNDKKYGAQLRKIFDLWKAGRLTEAQDEYSKTDWAQLDTDAQNRYLLSLENQNIYKERLKSWLIGIKRELASRNLKADDATLEDYYIRGIDEDTIIDELLGKANTSTGLGADNLEVLRTAARNNGVNLEQAFGTQIDDWLRRIERGEPIENFKRQIRETAAANQNPFVQNLLRSGQDLRDIYGYYIGVAANKLGIPESSIDINDPLLKSVFTDRGGISALEFDNLIRKDPRYTKSVDATQDKDFRQSIADRALSLGVSIDDSAIDEILNTALALGIQSVTPQVDALIRAKFRYVPGSITSGFAGDALQQLRKTAQANGINFDTQFGNQAQDWLAKIMQGESIDTYKREIRRVAGMGLPEKVQSMLDTGSDLESIYSPYRQQMAAILEIDPNSIQLNDPTLRSAIGQDKEMPLYEFQRSLRKDPRWQYTDNARQDLSNSALQVLRDFGFQG